MWTSSPTAFRRSKRGGAQPLDPPSHSSLVPRARASRAARRTPPCAPPDSPKASRTTTARSSNTPRSFGRSPTTAMRARLARAGQASRRAGPLHARPPAGVGRQARRSAGRVSARGRAQPDQPDHSGRDAHGTRAAARQDRRQRGRQDPPRDADSAQSLDAPLPGTDLPDDIVTARHADLPRRQRARRVHGDRQVRQRQRRVRSDVSRSADHHRPAQGRSSPKR